MPMTNDGWVQSSRNWVALDEQRKLLSGLCVLIGALGFRNEGRTVFVLCSTTTFKKLKIQLKSFD